MLTVRTWSDSGRSFCSCLMMCCLMCASLSFDLSDSLLLTLYSANCSQRQLCHVSICRPLSALHHRQQHNNSSASLGPSTIPLRLSANTLAQGVHA